MEIIGFICIALLIALFVVFFIMMLKSEKEKMNNLIEEITKNKITISFSGNEPTRIVFYNDGNPVSFKLTREDE